MKLFMLEITTDEFDDNPYDKTHMVIVEAEDNVKARLVAANGFTDEAEMWLSPKRSTVSELTTEGAARILKDFGWGSA
jgi:hypothetical protein